MARKIDGTQSTLRAARLISRMVRKYGAAKMAAALGPELWPACVVLELAVAAFDAMDDHSGLIDHTPGGYGDDAAPQVQ